MSELVQLRELTASEARALALDMPFTQTFFYGEWQKRAGRRVRRFIGEFSRGPALFFQTIEYQLPFGKSYIYIPYGPVAFVSRDEAVFKTLSDYIQRVFQNNSIIFVRLDCTPPLGEGELHAVRKHFCAAPASSYRGSYFQPRAEWMLDLARSDEELLRGMDKKNRYGIRVAEENGVYARIISRNVLERYGAFYTLLEETSQRDAFRLHAKTYYEAAFENVEKYGCGFLIETYYKNALATSDLVVCYGKTAAWVFGGSSTESREASPSYLAQWTAIKEAKRRGGVLYSFGGVSEEPYRERAWEGITRFKKRFGGRALIHSPFFDLVFSPFWYRFYMLQKRIRG